MKRRFGGGSKSAGRRLKKSPKRGPHHHLHRGKRIERAPPPLSHLGATRTDAGAAISLQLEDAVGDGGSEVVEFLLPVVSRDHSQSAGHRVPGAPDASHSRQVARRRGRIDRPSQPHDLGLHPPAARTAVGRVSPRLCARTESGRIFVVALEATRTAELLSAELRPAQPLCPESSASDAERAYAGDCLLAAGRTVSVVTILIIPINTDTKRRRPVVPIVLCPAGLQAVPVEQAGYRPISRKLHQPSRQGALWRTHGPFAMCPCI